MGNIHYFRELQIAWNYMYPEIRFIYNFNVMSAKENVCYIWVFKISGFAEKIGTHICLFIAVDYEYSIAEIFKDTCKADSR